MLYAHHLILEEMRFHNNVDGVLKVLGICNDRQALQILHINAGPHATRAAQHSIA